MQATYYEHAPDLFVFTLWNANKTNCVARTVRSEDLLVSISELTRAGYAIHRKDSDTQRDDL